jgi:hypothetical protein
MHKLAFIAPALTVAALLTFPFVGTAQDDSAGLFRHFQDARNRGDVEASMALVASDMQYVNEGPVCSPESPCGGYEAFRRNVQLSISDQVFTSVIGSVDVSGPMVQVRLLSTSPSRSAIGVERTLSDVTIEMVDGQITSWRSVSDTADPQTMWWLDHDSSREAIPQLLPH